MTFVRYIAIILAFLPGPLLAEGTITVTGTGETAAPPDMATISLSVRRQTAAAADAVAEMSEAAAAVLAKLRADGIAEADLQSSSLTLRPVYRRDRDDDGAREITGYSAETSITVFVRNLDQLGATLDAAVSSGANGFGGLSFGLKNPDAAEDAARRAAVADAVAKARVFADAAVVTLGPLQSLTEQGGYGGPMMMEARAMADGEAIAPGEVTVQATVTMVYEIAE